MLSRTCSSYVHRRPGLGLLALLFLPFLGGCQVRPLAEPLQYSDATVQQIRDRIDAMDW